MLERQRGRERFLFDRINLMFDSKIDMPYSNCCLTQTIQSPRFSMYKWLQLYINLWTYICPSPIPVNTWAPESPWSMKLKHIKIYSHIHSSYSWFSIPQTHKQYLPYPDMNQLSSNEMFTTIGRQTVLGKKERKLWDSMHHSFLPGFCWLEAKYIHINESRVDKQVFDVDQLLIALAIWAGICV